MKNEKITEEFQEINKAINRNKNELKDQNKKIHEINEKLEDTGRKTDIAKSYLSGFASIFGFFPKLFSSNKKTKNEAKPSVKETQSKEKTQPDINNNIISDELDELEKEIYDLNKNAKEMKNEIIKSKEGTQELNNKIEKTNLKIDKIKKEAEKIKNK